MTREHYQFQVTCLRMMGQRLNDGAPTLLGECGIPDDINGGDAYRRWADGGRSHELWQAHTTALRMPHP